MVKERKVVSHLYIAFMIFFLYMPIIVLIIFSFNNADNSTMFKGFTFKWYEKLLQDDIIKALKVTLSVAFIATIVSSFIGTISAIGIYNMKRFKKTALYVNNIPILNPDIVTGVSLMILFLALQMHFGYWTMLMAHIIFDTPYVILAIFPKLKQLDVNIMEAALDLGAKPSLAVRSIIIPQLMPGIITGALIAFTMSIDDFVISYFNSANGVNNLSMWIYSQTKRGVNPSANAISSVMLLIIITLMTIIAIRLSKDMKKKESTV